MPLRFNRHVVSVPEAMNVANSTCARIVQFGSYRANRSFDADRAGANTVKMSERCDKAYGAMTAHPEISDVVEEDNPGVTRRIRRCAQQRSNNCVRAARLVYNRRPDIVKPFTKPNQLFCDAAVSQVGASAEHQPGWLTAGMRVYD